jgi:hypothetical protein
MDFEGLKRQAILRWSRFWSPWAMPGSMAWLVATEARYGGRVTDVPRRRVSPHDHRTTEQVAKGGMIGGDRMLHHGYAPTYSRYLRPLRNRTGRLTILEVGILRGTGLALWCDLFPDARVIGVDIDLSHMQENWTRLQELGAFRQNTPEIHEFDQLDEGAPERLRQIVGPDRINLAIDDGLHSAPAILNTLRAALPLLHDRFVYFIEDNRHVHVAIRQQYDTLQVVNRERLTVVCG